MCSRPFYLLAPSSDCTTYILFVLCHGDQCELCYFIRYLHEHGVHREPLVHIVKSLVEEAVDELVREEVEGYISNTLRSYFTEAQATLLTSTLIEDMIDKQYLSLLVIVTVV